MRALALTIVAVVAVVVAASTATAGILGMHQLKLDFTRPGAAKQATWTSSPKLVLGPKGLELRAPGPEVFDLALTTEPMATGTSWRPAGGVGITATVSPAAAPVTLDNGQTYTPQPGRLYARYSPDAKHWSSWQVMAMPTPYHYSGELAVPRTHAAPYDELVEKYGKLDVPWKSDEEAAVQWILKAQPDFFAKHQPFVGYVQFLYEATLAGGQRIERLDADVSFGIGGAHVAAKDPKVAAKREGPWRFRAP
ncbi:MAG: hypothetical protein KF773_37145 [Deltaproteobacteria bacterium]|nr:hypothetical protein [Deltaproteobacteria bacterium]